MNGKPKLEDQKRRWLELYMRDLNSPGWFEKHPQDLAKFKNEAHLFNVKYGSNEMPSYEERTNKAKQQAIKDRLAGYVAQSKQGLGFNPDLPPTLEPGQPTIPMATHGFYGRTMPETTPEATANFIAHSTGALGAVPLMATHPNDPAVRAYVGESLRSPIGAAMRGSAENTPGVVGGVAGGAAGGSWFGPWGSVLGGLGGLIYGTGLGQRFEQGYLTPEDYQFLQEQEQIGAGAHPIEKFAGDVLPAAAAFGSTPFTAMRNARSLGYVAGAVSQQGPRVVGKIAPEITGQAVNSLMGELPLAQYVTSELMHGRRPDPLQMALAEGGGYFTQGGGLTHFLNETRNPVAGLFGGTGEAISPSIYNPSAADIPVPHTYLERGRKPVVMNGQIVGSQPMTAEEIASGMNNIGGGPIPEAANPAIPPLPGESKGGGPAGAPPLPPETKGGYVAGGVTPQQPTVGGLLGYDPFNAQPPLPGMGMEGYTEPPFIPPAQPPTPPPYVPTKGPIGPASEGMTPYNPPVHPISKGGYTPMEPVVPPAPPVRPAPGTIRPRVGGQPTHKPVYTAQPRPVSPGERFVLKPQFTPEGMPPRVITVGAMKRGIYTFHDDSGNVGTIKPDQLFFFHDPETPQGFGIPEQLNPEAETSPLGETPQTPAVPMAPDNTPPIKGEVRTGPEGTVNVTQVRGGNVYYQIGGKGERHNRPIMEFNQRYPKGSTENAPNQVVQQVSNRPQYQVGEVSGQAAETGSGNRPVSPEEGVFGTGTEGTPPQRQVTGDVIDALQNEKDRLLAKPQNRWTPQEHERWREISAIEDEYFRGKPQPDLGTEEETSTPLAEGQVEPRPGEPDTGAQAAATRGSVTLDELFPKITAYIRGRGTHYSVGKDAIIRAIEEDQHMDAETKQRVIDFLNHFPDQYWESMGFRFRTLLRHPHDPTITPWGLYHMGRATVEVSRWGHQVERFMESSGNMPEGYAADTFTHEFTHHLQRFLDENDYAALIKEYEQPGVEDAWKKTLDLNVYKTRAEQFDEWVQHQIQQLALKNIAAKNAMAKANPFQKAIMTLKVMAKTAADFLGKRGQPTASELVYRNLVEGKNAPRLTLHNKNIPGAHPRGATVYRDVWFPNRFPTVQERAAMHGLGEAPDILERNPQTGLPPLVHGQRASTNPFFSEVMPEEYTSMWGANPPPPLLPGMVTQDQNLMNSLLRQYPGLIQPAPPQPPGQQGVQPKVGDFGAQYSVPGPTQPTIPERVQRGVEKNKLAREGTRIYKQAPFVASPEVRDANQPRFTPFDSFSLPLSVVSPKGDTLQTGSLEAKIGPAGKDASQMMVNAARETERMMFQARTRLDKVRALLNYSLEQKGYTPAMEMGEKARGRLTGQPTTKEQLYSNFRQFIELPHTAQQAAIASGKVDPAIAEASNEYHKYTNWMKEYIYDYKKNVLGQKNMPPIDQWGITDRGYFYHTLFHDFKATVKDASGKTMELGADTYPELTMQIEEAMKNGGTLTDVAAKQNRNYDPTLRVDEGRFWRIVEDISKSAGKDAFGRRILPKQDVLDDIRGEIGMTKNQQQWLPMLMERAGKEGYEGDAFFRVMNQYAHTAINGIEISKLRRQLVPLAENIGRENPSAKDYIMNRINMMAGQPSQVEEGMANLFHEASRIAGFPGYNPNPLRSLRNAARIIQNTTAYATLTSRPSAALVNLSQPLVTLMPRIGRAATEQAYKDAYDPANIDMMRQLGVLSHDIKVANINGQLRTVMVAKPKTRYLTPIKGTQELFRSASEANRAVGFMAGYKSAIDAGLKHDDAVQEGLNYALLTEFTSNKAYTPTALSSVTGGLQFQYQGYAINNLKQWSDTVRGLKNYEAQGLTKGEAWQRLGRKLGAQATLGGAKSLIPFLVTSGTYYWLKDQGVPDPLARSMAYGAPSMGGIDFSGPTGVMPEFFGQTWQEAAASLALGPTANVAMKALQTATTPEGKNASVTEKLARGTGLGRQYLAATSLVTGKPLYFGIGTPNKEGVIDQPLDKFIVLMGAVPFEMTEQRGEAEERRTRKNPGPSFPDVNYRPKPSVFPVPPRQP